MTPSEKIRRELKLKSDLYKRVFIDDPDGAQILKGLQDMFDASRIFDPDPYVSALKLGQRDVIKYIESLLVYTPKETK
jgi:hypothetical protein